MILHNIAVKKRIALGSIESDGHYDVVHVDNNEEAATSRLNIEALCFVLLPQFTRMAEYHLNKLYNVTFRKNLSIAIAKELQEQYNLYKESKKKVRK
jgi:hypothetical protein